MTKEEQRIAIAEACGIKVIRTQPRAGGNPIKGIHQFLLLDYLNDLNAMHEAEKVLTEAQKAVYAEILCTNLDLVDWGYYPGESEIDWNEVSKVAFATASQRAEAFLHTIDKWTE